MSSKETLNIILNSPLFDAEWYVQRYPEVRRSGLAPAWHYLWVGGKIGYDPGPDFSAKAYTSHYEDVEASGLNPLVHYECHGRAEGRRITAQSLPAPEAALFINPEKPRSPAHQRIFDAMEQMVAGTRPGLGFSRRAPATGPENDNVGDYAVLTPTGDRAVFFNLCMHMVATQTLRPRQWVVVDDGQVPLSDLMELPDWVTYVRRSRLSDDPPHTLSVNVLAGLEHVSEDRILIMEDDDWYAPYYAEFMLDHLQDADLVGLNRIIYYHVVASMWKTATLPRHTAFAQSGFRRGHAFDHLAAVCRTNFTEIREKGVLDRHWWQTFEGEKTLIGDHPCLHVGFKGAVGRPGLADGHRRNEPDYVPDPEHSVLRQSIGPDSFYYNRWHETFRKPYALYTAVTADQALPDIGESVPDHFDLFALSDRELPQGTAWQAVPFDQHWHDPELQKAKPRALPHLYFPDHEWSVWIDPSVTLDVDPGQWINQAINQRADVAVFEYPAPVPAFSCPPEERLLSRYMINMQEYGLPLYDNRFVVRRHNRTSVSTAMVFWLKQIRAHGVADPIAFSFALWQAGLEPAVLSDQTG